MEGAAITEGVEDDGYLVEGHGGWEFERGFSLEEEYFVS